MNELSYNVASKAVGEPLLADADFEQISQLEPEIAADQAQKLREFGLLE